MDPLTLAEAEKIISDYEKSLQEGDDKVQYHDLKKERSALRRKLTRSVTTLKTELAREKPDVNKIKIYVEIVDSNYEKLDSKQLDIEFVFKNDVAVEADSAIHYENYQLPALNIKAKAQETIDASNQTAVTKSAQILLPKAQLPKFSGKNAAEYESFIHIFESMVGTKNLSKSEKLTYLKLCLSDDAEVIARGYTEITDANYDNLLLQLKTKYGQPRLIQRDYYYSLYDLPSFQWSSISTWVNKFTTHIRSLESIGVDIEANSGFIVTLAQRKMPLSLF